MPCRRHSQAVLLLTFVLFVCTSLTILKQPDYSPAPTGREATGGLSADRPHANSPGPSEADEATRARVDEAYGRLPLSFEVNAGQFGPEVRYASRGRGYSLYLTPGEAVLALSKQSGRRPAEKSQAGQKGDRPDAGPAEVDALRMRLVGASDSPEIRGAGRQQGVSNYLVGKDPARWHTNVAHYSSVEYRGVYTGIDLVYHGRQRQLEYDFVVAPQADPGQIRVAFAGADGMRVDESGDLLLAVAGGEVRQHKPVIFQEINGERKEIAGRYVITGREEIGFEIGEYDPTRPLVIDPILSYSTLLGVNEASGIAVDSAGNAYIICRDTSSGQGRVIKLNAAGTALVYSTTIGGSLGSTLKGIAVNSAGEVYVTGDTYDEEFPTTVGAFDTTFNGSFGYDAFVAKLNAAGNALVYSTFLGGGGYDYGNSIALDSAGNAYVAGYTDSNDFPMLGAPQGSQAGSYDVFVTKLNSAGSALLYSTYLGGSYNDYGNSIAVDSAGNAFVAGETVSDDFPLQGALQASYGGGTDAFVAKLNAAGGALVYSTYLGGSGSDKGKSLVVDSAGNAIVTGETYSSNFPLQGALQASSGGNSDVFVSKLNPAGSALVYSTYLGGSGYDLGKSLAVDSAGNAHVTGSTASPNFPIRIPFQFFNAGGSDAFVLKITSTGSAVHSTYLGGQGDDSGNAIALDSTGTGIYVTGSSSNNYSDMMEFPTTAGAFMETSDSTSYGFATRIDSSKSGSIYKSIKGQVQLSSGKGIAGASVSLTGTKSATTRYRAAGATQTRPDAGHPDAPQRLPRLTP